MQPIPLTSEFGDIFEEVKAKTEAGDAYSKFLLGLCYYKGEGVAKGQGGGGEMVSQSRRTESRRGAIRSGPLIRLCPSLLKKRARGYKWGKYSNHGRPRLLHICLVFPSEIPKI